MRLAGPKAASARPHHEPTADAHRSGRRARRAPRTGWFSTRGPVQRAPTGFTAGSFTARSRGTLLAASPGAGRVQRAPADPARKLASTRRPRRLPPRMRTETGDAHVPRAARPPVRGAAGSGSTTGAGGSSTPGRATCATAPGALRRVGRRLIGPRRAAGTGPAASPQRSTGSKIARGRGRDDRSEARPPVPHATTRPARHRPSHRLPAPAGTCRSTRPARRPDPLRRGTGTSPAGSASGSTRPGRPGTPGGDVEAGEGRSSQPARRRWRIGPPRCST